MTKLHFLILPFFLAMILTSIVSCFSDRKNNVRSVSNLTQDTLFRVLHKYNYADRTKSFYIEMYDSVNTNIHIDSLQHPFGIEVLLRDIYLNPISSRVESDQWVKMFFLLLKIKDAETLTQRGDYYNPYINISNFFTTNSYTTKYQCSDFNWMGKTSDITLVIHSISDKVLTLYESFSEVDSPSVETRTYVLLKGGNYLEITLNQEMAEEFRYTYSYFFK